MELTLPAGRWTTAEALLLPTTPGPPPLQPLLLARYPARKAIKDKDWPKYMERALRAVQDNEKLKKYDVLPPDLRDQYDVIGWMQVMLKHPLHLCNHVGARADILHAPFALLHALVVQRVLAENRAICAQSSHGWNRGHTRPSEYCEMLTNAMNTGFLVCARTCCCTDMVSRS